MNELAGFHHVALSVTDLDSSTRWYEQVLGFTVLFREGEPGDDRTAAVMQFAEGAISVGLVAFAGNDHDFDERRTGLDHVAFAVETRADLEASSARLTDAGIEHSGVIEVPPGAILNLRDPDGIALALFWHRPT